MSIQNLPLTLSTPATYHIHVVGHLDTALVERLGFTCVHVCFPLTKQPATLLEGSFIDQPALFGMLNRLSGMGLVLLSAECVEVAPPEQ